MAATKQGQHELADVDTQATGWLRPDRFTAHCSCGWNSGEWTKLAHAERAFCLHVKEAVVALPVEGDDLHTQLEDLRSTVWQCEDAWRLEARIDQAVRLSS